MAAAAGGARGTFGTVYTSGDGIALKIAHRPGDVFSHELAALLGCAGIPNLVQPASDVLLESEGRQVLHLKQAPGHRVWELIQAKTLTLFDRVAIVKGVLEALRGMQERGYLHLDVKSANIMYDQNSGAVTLVDLGGATPIDEFRTLSRSPEVVELIGRSYQTFAYRDPLLMLGVYGPHNDLWSVGCLIAELQGTQVVAKVTGLTPETENPFQVAWYDRLFTPPVSSSIEGIAEPEAFKRLFRKTKEGKILPKAPYISESDKPKFCPIDALSALATEFLRIGDRRPTIDEALARPVFESVRSFRCLPLRPKASAMLAIGEDIVWKSPDPKLIDPALLFHIKYAKKYTLWYKDPEGPNYKAPCEITEDGKLTVTGPLEPV